MKKTILVVEDDMSMGMLIQLALEEAGAVEHIADGRAAAERIAREPVPDAVVLDVGLPGLSGHEVLARLRASETTRTVPVLMLTAHDRERAVEGGGDHRPDAYLTKPFDITELAAVVSGLLGR